MTQKLHPWENPEQDYARTLAKRRSERRYRSLQLVKTLKILLTEFYFDDNKSVSKNRMKSLENEVMNYDVRTFN